MTPQAQPPLRIIAFGDLDAGVWGAAIAIGAGRALFVAAVGSERLNGAAVVTGTDDTGEWGLSTEGVELTLAPAGDPVYAADANGLDGFDQLCAVRGRLGSESELDPVECVGRRAERVVGDPRDFDSMRDVSAWFGDDDGVALTAVRRRKARGHDRDLTVAAILDPAGTPTVEEPRLSTTYDADGLPARVGLELWLPEQDGEQPFPRRAAGEAAGAAAGVADDELTLTARLLRCHSRGNEGTGVYLMLRRQ